MSPLVRNNILMNISIFFLSKHKGQLVKRNKGHLWLCGQFPVVFFVAIMYPVGETIFIYSLLVYFKEHEIKQSCKSKNAN